MANLLNSGFESEITVKFGGKEITETRIFDEGEKEGFIYETMIELGFSGDDEFMIEWSESVNMPNFEEWHAEVNGEVVAVERVWDES